MDFGLTGEQEMLRTLVERFVADRYATADRAALRLPCCGYSVANWTVLAEMGLLGLMFAEAHDGTGAGEVEMITTMEALGRGLVAEPFLTEILLAGRLLEQAGTKAQTQTWLPRIVAGEAHVALAYAEHATRFDLAACTTRVQAGRIAGAKTFVPGAADAYIVTASDNGETKLCLVESQAPGLIRRDYCLVDGSVASELHFEDVPAAPLAGGMAVLESVAQSARIGASAEMIGLMSLLFDSTLDYVRQREQFGGPIGGFQAIQHRLADVYISLELARAHLYRSVLSPPDSRDAAIAAAKSYISTAAIRLGEECIQFHGGMGVSDELSIGHAHKRILVLASFLGDADHELVRYNNALNRGERPESG